MEMEERGEGVGGFRDLAFDLGVRDFWGGARGEGVQATGEEEVASAAAAAEEEEEEEGSRMGFVRVAGECDAGCPWPCTVR